MYVSFPVSQREFLRIQEEGRALDRSDIRCRLRFADGSVYNQSGTINFVDVSVDRGTDTLLVRATFPNPSGGLVDGQLVRVALESKKLEEKDGAASGTHSRPSRCLCFHCRGRQGSRSSPKAWRRGGPGRHRGAGPGGR